MDKKTQCHGQIICRRYVVMNIQNSEVVFQTKMIILKRKENVGDFVLTIAKEVVFANPLKRKRERNIYAIAIVKFIRRHIQ